MRKFRIVVEGKPYEVEVEEIGSESVQSSLTSVSQVREIAAVKPVVNTAGTQLKSPMPGNVLKLSVPNGSAVKKGQTILVLEAMKMENDIAANADGIVSFNVNKGSTVNTGDLLAVIA